jgi:dolichol-phosphate mannosyltransferase
LTEKMRVAAVIPAFNEEANIGRVVRGIRRARVAERVYVVDDGSRDSTAAVARRAGALVIRHRRNTGVGSAIRDGYRAALKARFAVVLVMGGDDQDRPEEARRLLGEIGRGADFAQGSRWLPGGRTVNIPLFRRLGTTLYSAVFSVVAGRRMTDATNGFRAVRSRILEAVDLARGWLDRYELEPYLLMKAVKLGFRVREVAVTKRYHVDGRSWTRMRPLLDWWSIFRPLLLLATGIRD